jgi:hypothetical protein
VHLGNRARLDKNKGEWQNTATRYMYGGVGAPVGLTVFKTDGGSLGAVPGGFDSHTPLPNTVRLRIPFVFLPIGFGDFQNLCFLFPPPKQCFPFKSKEISFIIESQDSLMLYSMDEMISKKKELKKQALIFNLCALP